MRQWTAERGGEGGPRWAPGDTGPVLCSPGNGVRPRAVGALVRGIFLRSRSEWGAGLTGAGPQARMGSQVLPACARPGGRCWLTSSHEPGSGGRTLPIHTQRTVERGPGRPRQLLVLPGQAGTVPGSRCGGTGAGREAQGPRAGPASPVGCPHPTWPLGLSLSCLPAHTGLRLGLRVKQGGGGGVSGGPGSPEMPQA